MTRATKAAFDTADSLAAGTGEGQPEWDLSDLYASPDDPRLEADLAGAAASAAALAAEYKGRLQEIDGDALAAMIERYETTEDQLGRVYAFAQLSFVTRRDDPVSGRFFQGVQERVNDISTALLFVTLELNKLDDDDLGAKHAGSASLARYRPWLDSVRAYRPHQLADEIERVLHEKHITGNSAWNRLFDESMAGLRFPYEGRELSTAEAFDLLSSKDRSVREAAATSIGKVLRANERLFARIMNTIVKDKAIEDGWRGFKRPISSRNLANKVEDEVVDALIAAVKASYPRTAHRYYALKARWMGLDKLQYWDRNAPLPEDADARLPWDEARRTVIEAYRGFSPTLADIVTRFFDDRWIDAAVHPGKDSGAFCHPVSTSVHPYVLMNYQGRNRDVMTLAHELGHGVHQTLAAAQGPLMASTPLTLAETASVFGEQLTFRSLLNQETDPVRRRILLAAKIEDMLNTVVRQIAFAEFERQVHDARRQAELTPDDLARMWMELQAESLGPAFEFREDYRSYWTYISHFIHVPFYVYAYAFGDCLVNSLYAVYEQQPEGFEQRYLELLAAGGTKKHKELLAPFGLDATEPDFWAKGLGLLEGYVDELETALEAKT